MSSPGKLLQIAATIQSRVSNIEEHMKTNALPQASFAISSPLEVQLPPALSAERDQALEALTDLHALLSAHCRIL